MNSKQKILFEKFEEISKDFNKLNEFLEEPLWKKIKTSVSLGKDVSIEIENLFGIFKNPFSIGETEYNDNLETLLEEGNTLIKYISEGWEESDKLLLFMQMMQLRCCWEKINEIIHMSYSMFYDNDLINIFEKTIGYSERYKLTLMEYVRDFDKKNNISKRRS